MVVDSWGENEKEAGGRRRAKRETTRSKERRGKWKRVKANDKKKHTHVASHLKRAKRGLGGELLCIPVFSICHFPLYYIYCLSHVFVKKGEDGGRWTRERGHGPTEQ